MALIDKAKFGSILDTAKQVGALVDSAKLGINSLSQTENPSQGQAIIAPKETNESIETIDQLQDCISSLNEELSPAMVQVLKSQIQVLGTISSPTMTGMMIDNLVLGLQQSLDTANDNQYQGIRESYIRLIQNYVFMAEAKMHYVVDKNKEEANRLLEESGKMLADTFFDIAVMAVPAGGPAGKVLKSVNKSMFALKPSSGGDILSNIVKFFNTKAAIEEKQKEFYTTIENLFDTFENYPDLFGQSIVINGMLSKYRKILLERFTSEKIKLIKNQSSVAELKKASQLSDDISKTLKNLAWNEIADRVVKITFDSILTRKAAQYDLQTYFLMSDAFNAEINELKAILDAEENRLKELEEEKKKIGFFKFAEKKESEKSIEEQLEKLKECKKDVRTAEKKLKELESYFPEAKAVKGEIDRYNNRLHNIELLYLS